VHAHAAVVLHAYCMRIVCATPLDYASSYPGRVMSVTRREAPMMKTETASTLPPRVSARAHRVLLRDGAAIDVRPIQPDDGERLRCLHARLSPASIRMRYFHVVPSLSDALVATITHVDYVDRMALVATVGADNATALRKQEIVGMVNYDRISADAAEVAFVVEDAWQGRGVASTLLYDLAAYARECGFRRFLAITLRHNIRMLNVLRQCGFPCTLHDRGDEEVDAWVDIAATPMCRLGPFTRRTVLDVHADVEPEPEPTYP
jgi:RimJ/RimL family protein N-acetyltransferase